MIRLEGVEASPPGRERGKPPVLQRVTLALAPGEQVAVIGPSGAGKTTLLQVMACALRPSAGRYTLENQDPWTLAARDLRALRSRLFLAPQVPPLPPRQRVITAVLAGRLPTWGLARSVASLLYPSDIPAAHAALDHFGLGERLFDRVDRLSGGERQRVGLARAIVSPAKLWLVDEPLSALDPLNVDRAALVLGRQARAAGATLVASLHHVEMAMAHFPRIIGLQRGHIVFDAPPAQISEAMLKQLYRNEVREAATPPVARAAEPVAMQCR